MNVFVPGSREIVFADVHPSITDIELIWKHRLIHDDRICLTCMIDGIDRTFSCGSDGGNTNIDGICAIIHAGWEHPLGCTGRRSGARFRETHHSTLGTACCNIRPTLCRRFDKTGCPIIHNDPGRRDGRECQCRPGWIDLRSIINKGRIGNPQRFGLIVNPRVGPTSHPAIRVN